MAGFCIFHFLSFIVLIGSRIEARAFPNSQEIAGVSLGGLHAGIKTNLFADDGPLAQLGNDIMSGASGLEAEFNDGAKALESGLSGAANFLSQGSQEPIAGVNIGGLHAELKTNLFSDDGPLAQVGNELTAGADQVQKDLEDGANALGASLTGAFGDLESGLSGGLQSLDNSMTSGAASLGSLFQGSGELSSMEGNGGNTNGNAGISISGSLDLPDIESNLNSGSTGFSISGQNSGKSKTGGSGGLVFDEITGSSNLPKNKRKLSGGSSSSISISGRTSGQPMSNKSGGLIIKQISEPKASTGSSSISISGKSSGLPKTSSSSAFVFNHLGNQNSGTKNGAIQTTINADLSGGSGSNGAASTLTKISATGDISMLPPELLAQILKSVDLSTICKAA